jgi:3-hydroxyisobutyrate dehydrogenase-like beta-hydroxyacid dehydrogenase
MARVGFIGLGRMGAGMATRLIAAGHDVAVWNRTAEKCAPLVALGARAVDRPREVAAGADAVFSMVADDAASREVWFGANGALDNATRGALAIECSTLSLRHVDVLSQAAIDRGLSYIDCPVTGWPDAAAAGTLTLLIGAATQDLERARPLLSAVGTTLRHFGAVGTGTGFKLINNLLGAVQIAALAEAIVLAERLGLDRETVVAALEAGAVASPQVKKHARPMAERSFAAAPPFTAGLRHKDARYCLEAAGQVGAEMPIGMAAAHWFDLARRHHFDADEGRIVETVEKSVRGRM